MFDPRDLLGSLLGSGLGGRNPRMGGMPGGMGGGLGGGMGGGDVLGGLLGGLTGGGGGLGGLGGLGGGMGGGMGGGLGGLGGALGGGMSRGGMGGGVQGALIGMLGGMAMSALQRRMQGAGARAEAPVAGQEEAEEDAAPLPPPPSAPVTRHTMQPDALPGESVPELSHDRATLLIRVMVAAANADMRMDQEERSRILGKLDQDGTDAEAQAFLEREMHSPMTIEEIAREVSGPDVAVQVYAAALGAIDVDKAMERQFLATLAQRLGLEDEVVSEIHASLGQPQSV